MDIQPRIEQAAERKLVGLRLTMTLANNLTSQLWRAFMPRRNEIHNNISNELFSVQLYPASFDPGNPDMEFEKWAAMQVGDAVYVPDGMEVLAIPAGPYAIFHYKGSSTDTRIFEYIFRRWLPSSPYELDSRPHVEILGEKYKNNDPDSEEEIWIPVKSSS